MFDFMEPPTFLDRIEVAIFRWRGLDKWLEAEATVDSVTWYSDVEAGDYYKISISYWVDGHIEGGTFICGGSPRFPPYSKNHAITVFYNPKNPSRYFLPDSLLYRFPFRIAIIVLCILVAIALFAAIH